MKFDYNEFSTEPVKNENWMDGPKNVWFTHSCVYSVRIIIFLPSGPKVPLLLPAADRKGCIFGLTR